MLKPTLVGGRESTKEWIKLAEERSVKWWMTSALESNIGLGAVAKFTNEFDNPLPQGLGSGGLYHNNIPSPMVVKGEFLELNGNGSWDYSSIERFWRYI